MKKIKLLAFLFVSICFSLLINQEIVSAKSQIESQSVSNVSKEIVGQIHLYDDYSVEFLYRYRVKNINVKVCYEQECKDVIISDDARVNENHTSLQKIEYSLVEYLPLVNGVDTKYRVEARADFKSSATGTLGSIITLNKEVIVTLKVENDEEDKEEFFKEVNDAVVVINKFVIPGLYILLGLVIIIKGVLLAIGLMQHADDEMYRKEKLRAFLILFAVLALVAILNTGAGFITGLFG